MDVMESNRMIAEFDGWKFIPKSASQFTNEHYERGEDWCSINSFTYHNDWNALMPVVERIEAMDYHVTIYKSYCAITHSTDSDFIIIPPHGKSLTKIEAVYTAVTAFLEFKRKGRV